MPRGQKVVKPSCSSSITPPSSSPPWVELPMEITANILQRLGTVEILENAERVCSTWWKVCHDPAMWRVIDLKYDDPSFKTTRVLEQICRIAVERSQGQLLKINIDNFGSKDLLDYIAQRSSQLRHLRLVKCYNLAGGLAAVAKNFPLLEELHFHSTVITQDDIESVGCYCPLLKSFILNDSVSVIFGLPSSHGDYQALAIARSMPKLQHLSLLENTFTNVGLQAILDGCPHLELLDLRRCYNLNLEADLGRRCRQQIVDLKLPHDSTHDYEFDSGLGHYWAFDDGYKSVFADIAYDYSHVLGLRDYQEYDYGYFDEEEDYFN
ncbi:putative F-box/LRR-repeat protein 9 [Nicotiana tabacum]|uniref:F-box/LRR-repeat protein 23 n=2 Tax=Nicotiana TaxID=4085 RepID=A0A1S4A261_TOBAC|nr:PREDICTED: putative F-box/LRR-repeat protein 23 [Nicotiana sylvestris]XP_016470656.1 PREDICTED: putative F-box/LRR-repeat protein 23 [Nicotiana tabacum]